MSLASAIAAFIAHQCDRSRMDVPTWAETYRCGVEDVRAEWERQMSAASLKPTNDYDMEGK